MTAVSSRIVAATFAVLAAGGMATWSPAHATNATTIKIVEPGTTFFGRSYNRLAGQWWNWALKEPDATNPVTDNTGEDCARNQSGPIWFLAGTFYPLFPDPVTRNCTVPAGKAIFFPFANSASVYPDFPEKDNRCTLSGRFDLTKPAGRLGGVRCDANDDLIGDATDTEVVEKFVNLKVTIDDLSTAVSPDVRVGDLYAYRAQTQPGGYTQQIPPGSVFVELLGFEPGPRFPSVADGYWIFLKPLPVGQYRIHFEATDRIINEKVDVTYNLQVN